MKRISPRALARGKLLELYHCETESLGRKPNGNEFFPVDLNKLLRLLLPEWQMIEREDLLQVDVYHPLLGKVDFTKKKIYVNAGDPLQRYTVAHERGHVRTPRRGRGQWRRHRHPA